MWADRGIEETKERTVTSLSILVDGERDGGTATGAEWSGDGIRVIVIEKGPSN